MIVVNRRTFIAKRGHLSEVISLLKAGDQKRFPYRVYRPHYAPFDTVAFEVEFTSVAEMDSAWDEWAASPEAATFNSRWVEITETGGTNEVWTLE
jgi:hypothetical protein